MFRTQSVQPRISKLNFCFILDKISFRRSRFGIINSVMRFDFLSIYVAHNSVLYTQICYKKRKKRRTGFAVRTESFESLNRHEPHHTLTHRKPFFRDILSVGPFYSLFSSFSISICGASAISNDSERNTSHRYKDSYPRDIKETRYACKCVAYEHAQGDPELWIYKFYLLIELTEKLPKSTLVKFCWNFALTFISVHKNIPLIIFVE